ncbi:tyrosine-type recombinase/integrase [Pseudomonadota bacterium]
MTPLREKMIDAMLMRGFSIRTQTSYLSAVTALASYYHRCPSRVTYKEIQAYLLYLVKHKQLSPSSIRLYFNGLRFLYVNVLGWSANAFLFDLPKRKQRIPQLLTQDEVQCIIQGSPDLKQKTLFSVCYGCGLRVSELVALRTQDIDIDRSVLGVVQGKGGKDRHVILPHSLLAMIHHYQARYTPKYWLFYSVNACRALCVNSVQRYFSAIKQQQKIEKEGGPHMLRHAYATHQLAAGMSLHLLKQQLGHAHIASTYRYLHWLPNESLSLSADLLAGLEVSHE